ncbi:MAG: oxidoreductase, partial [Planctomyces sp.]|nr:oxidoreductase [Planctomyces sp.]
MNLFEFPWLEMAIAISLAGIPLISWAERPVGWTIGLCTLVLICVGMECGLHHADIIEMDDHRVAEWLDVDILSAPVLPVVALLHLLAALMVPRIHATNAFCSSICLSMGLQLATFGCTEPSLLVLLLIAGALPPLWEMWRNNRHPQLYLLHMIPFAVFLLLGWFADELEMKRLAVACWMIAALIRSGTFPAHAWVPSLFETSNFGTSILFVVPMVGFYAALRMVLPMDPPEWILQLMGAFSLLTAILSSGLAVVQQDARKMFARLVLSHTAMTFVGLELLTPLSLTGSLAHWLSSAISLCGLGLVLWSLEARFGSLDISQHRGLYSKAPAMGAFLLLMGLASVGFPGTVGFASSELLIDGAVTDNVLAGLVVVISSLLNGIAIMRMYFLLFTGKQHSSVVSLGVTPRERFAVGLLTLVIFGTGIQPQIVLASRHRAAHLIVDELERDHSVD